MAGFKALAMAMAASAVSAATTFTVDAPTMKYVSGKDVTPGGDVSASSVFWHDVTTTPLVVQYNVSTGSADKVNTPASGFLKVTAVHKSSNLASVQSISSASVLIDTSGKWLVSYTVTFSAGAYGTYKIGYTCSALTNANGDAGTCPGTTGTASVSIGSDLALSIQKDGTTVSTQWLDADLPYKFVVGTADSTAAFNTSSFNTAPSTFVVDGTLGSLPLAAVNISSSVTAMKYDVDLNYVPGYHWIAVPQGTFMRTDGVYNVAKNLTVQTGFKPLVSFSDTARSNVDTASYPTATVNPDSTLLVSTPTAPFWFSATQSSVQMVIAGVTGATALSYGVAAGQLLAGASSLPGSAARSGGITVSAATADNAAGTYTYPLAISGIKPGVYDFPIPQGALKNALGYGNAALTPKLRVGYEVRMKILANATDVTTSWLDSYQSYKLNILPSVGGAFATPMLAPAYASASPVIGDVATTTFESNTTAAVVYTFNVNNATAQTTSIAVLQGAFVRSDGISNTFSSIPVRVGFRAVVSFWDSLGRSQWFSPVKSLVALNVTAPGYTLSTSPPAYSTAGLFKDAAALPGADVVAGGIALNASGSPSVGLAGEWLYPIKVSNVPAGTYTFAIPAGVVCTAVVCNAPSAGTLTVGYDIEYTIKQGGKDVTGKWVDAASSFELGFGPNNGYSFTSAIDLASGATISPSTGLAFPASANTAAWGDNTAVYSIASATTTAGTYTVTVPAGTYVRSDGAANAEGIFIVQAGFKPTLTFTAATVAVDAKWIAPSGVSAVAKVTVDAGGGTFNTPPTWAAIFADAPALPGNGAVTCAASAESGTGSVLTYPLTFASALAPGVYTVTVPAGVISKTLSSKTSYNAEFTASLHIGFPVEVSFVNATGSDASEPQDLTTLSSGSLVRSIYVKLAVPASVDTSLASAVAANNAAAPFTNVFNGTTAVVVGDGSVVTPNSTTYEDGAFVLLYKVKTATASTTLGLIDGALCTSSDENSKICAAPGGATVFGGNVLTAEIMDATSNSYLGLLDADGAPTVAATASVPTLASTVKVVFTGALGGATSMSDAALKAALVLPDPKIAVTSAVASAGTTITYTLSLSEVAAGTYDLVLPAGAVTNTAGGVTSSNAKCTVRLIVGADVRFYKLATSSSVDTPVAGEEVKRLHASTYSTSASDLVVRVYGLKAASLLFSNIFADVTDAKGNSVLGAIVASTTPVSSVADPLDPAGISVLTYQINVGGLPDGAYTFKVNSSAAVKDKWDATAKLSSVATQKLVIDRAAPVGAASSVVAATPIVIGRRAFGIPLPAGLFTDAQASKHAITVTGTALNAQGFKLVGPKAGLKTATLATALLTSGPNAVAPPSGNVIFSVTGTDPAGNSATALLSVPVVQPLSVVLSAVDARGVSSQSTLKAKPVDGTLALTVNADFETTVTGVKGASLACSIAGAPCVGYAVSVSPADGVTKARRFVFTVKLGKDDVSKVANKLDAAISFALDVTGVLSADAIPAAVPKPVLVKVDSEAPGGPGTFTAPNAARVNGRYTLVLPTTLFQDKFSAAGAIAITAASPSSQFGLAFTAGLQGSVATITGVPSAVPPSGSVFFSLTAEDEAGNSITVPRAVEVKIGAAPASPATITLASTTLQFTEGNAALALDTLAAFKFDGTVDSVTAYLTAPETTADAAAGSEVLLCADASLVNSWTGPDTTTAGKLTYSPGVPGALSASQVQSWLRYLRYNNSRSDVTAGVRTVRIDVVANSSVVASAARLIKVVPVNNVPDVYSALPIAFAFAEGVDSATLFKDDVAVFDGDDSELTSATLAFTGGCDSKRDVLYLPFNYVPGAAPKVVATWAAASCQLTLKPAAPVAKLPFADFATAVKGVRFTTLDAKNPTNGVASAVTRVIKLTVTDNAASGRLPATATSTSNATGTLTITHSDNAPVVDVAKAYAAGGFLSSSDAFANTEYVSNAAGVLPVKRFVARLGATESSATVTVSFDLLKVADGVFAGGAITDVDTYDPIATGVVIGDGPIGSSANVLTTTPSWVASAPSFDYYAVNFSSKLTMTVTAGVADANLGKKTLTFTYGTAATVEFYLDVRREACMLAATDLDSAATNAMTDATKYYPNNALCTFKPKTVSVSEPKNMTISRGEFAASKSKMASAAADLAALGVPVAQQVAALAGLRAAARGTFALALDSSSLLGAGSISLSADVASSATADKVGALPLPAGATLDKAVLLKLGPAGTTFSKPVRVCIFVGDTPASKYRSLVMASQVDPADEAKGYLPLTTLASQSFNPATGELCGDTTHFSAFGSVSTDLPANPTVSKAHLMGGSCPNQCSGKGFCRQEGKCTCFPGYQGYDCSLRSCPSAESWGEPASNAHSQTECAGRGVCDRAVGKCACFEGFEGSACERQSCPNDCSGHGACRTLAELPVPAQTGYASWEARRVQKCVCDGGYTGADCSQRVCPFGDDPETICAYTARQVQRVALYFETAPAALLPIDYATDEFALDFTSKEGKSFTTARISNVWTEVEADTLPKDMPAAALDAAKSIKSALTALPEFSVTDVTVNPVLGGAGKGRSVAYDVTFTGATNTGNENLLSCPFNSDGYTLGCTAPGCRPKFAQLKLFTVDKVQPSNGVFSVSPLAILQQPAALAGGNDASTVGQWGVETALTVTRYKSGLLTYKFAGTKVYGTSTTAVDVPETPMPPSALRASVPGPYGLLVDFDSDSSLEVSFPTPASSNFVARTYTFKWRLPKCEVTQVSAADKDLEKAECSNRGVCDRTTGQCACFNGYSGSNCAAQVVYI